MSDTFLLDHDDPLYGVQQQFCQDAIASRSEDPDVIFDLACEGYNQGKNKRTVPPNIGGLFRAWAKVQAERNKFSNNDPWLQALEAWEDNGMVGPAPAKADYATTL